MDPQVRTWWRLLDELPGRLRRVACWREPQAAPPRGEGHMHTNPTLVSCLAGVVRVRRLGPRPATLDLAPGEVLLIAGGVWHHQEPLRAGAVWYGQGFMPGWSDVVLGGRGGWSGKLPSDPSRRLMDAALAADDLAERVRLIGALVAEVLGQSVTHLAWDHPALRRMLETLWRRCASGVTVDDLVRASGLGRAQAYAVFTAGAGVTPRTAIATSRLWLAESLLRSGVGVAETARRAGYPNAGTFTRCWKRAHGHPPRDG